MGGMPFTYLQAPTTPAPPPAAEAPQAPGMPTTTPIAAPQSFGQFRVPQTAAEYEMLKAQRAEMSRQVNSVRDRRQGIARQYESATGANRAGLDQQLRVLDERILQI